MPFMLSVVNMPYTMSFVNVHFMPIVIMLNVIMLIVVAPFVQVDIITFIPKTQKMAKLRTKTIKSSNRSCLVIRGQSYKTFYGLRVRPGANPRVKGAPLWGRLLANIRLGRKGLSGTNALANYENS